MAVAYCPVDDTVTTDLVKQKTNKPSMNIFIDGLVCFWIFSRLLSKLAYHSHSIVPGGLDVTS